MVVVRKGTSKLGREKILAKLAAEKAARDAAAKAGTKVAVVAPAAVSTTAAAPSIALTPQTAEATPATTAVVSTSDTRPVKSSNLFGQDIKTNEEGRMSLKDIEQKNFLEQLIRGTVVPTEQIVGIAKDVAYGVESKDQASMESGLDLIINPLLKPFVDPRMKDAGVINDEWYWPEELKSDWKVLPEFMQKGSGENYTPETRTFLDGAGANLGNIGAVVTSPLAGAIAAEELQTSSDRFARAPGYYIGSAIGEVPYFLIGAGQVKAAATISARTTAGVLRGGVKGTAGIKLIAKAYKVERAADELSTAAALANKSAFTKNKLTSGKAVRKAVKTLKSGYDDVDQLLTKEIKSGKMKGGMYDTAVETQALSRIKSGKLNKWLDTINEIEDPVKTPRGDPGSPAEISRLQKIEKYNKDVSSELVPEVKQFKNRFLAETVTQTTGTRVERIASSIQGSPSGAAARIDRFFNPPGSTLGDNAFRGVTRTDDEGSLIGRGPLDDTKVGGTLDEVEDLISDELPSADININNIFETNIRNRLAGGEYDGVLGSIKLNKHLFGNVVKSALGVNRAEAKMQDLAQLISKTVLTTRTLDKRSVDKLKDNIDKDVLRVEMVNDDIMTLRKQGNTDVEIQMNTELVDFGNTVPQQLALNKDKIIKLKETKDTGFRQLSFATDEKPSYNKKYKNATAGYSETGYNPKDVKTSLWVMDYDTTLKAFPELRAKYESETINVAVKPSVSIQKTDGIIHGTIGDTPETSMDFWVQNINRKDAITQFGGETYLSPSSIWKQIGLKKVNTPIGKYRTLMPWKAQQQEQIVTIYQASDYAQIAGRSNKAKAGVRPIVTAPKDISPQSVRLLQSMGYMEDFTGYQNVAKMIGADPNTGNKRIFQLQHTGKEITDKAIAEEMLPYSDRPYKAFDEIPAFGGDGFETVVRSKSPLSGAKSIDVNEGSMSVFKNESYYNIDTLTMHRAMIMDDPKAYLAAVQNKKKKIQDHKSFISEMISDQRKKINSQLPEDGTGSPFMTQERVDLQLEDLAKFEREEIAGVKGTEKQLDNILSNENVYEVQKILKKNQWGTPRGTLTSVSVARLRQFGAATDMFNESGVVVENMKSRGDFYYRGKDAIYKIKNMTGPDRFNPAMITTATNIKQTQMSFGQYTDPAVTPNPMNQPATGERLIGPERYDTAVDAGTGKVTKIPIPVEEQRLLFFGKVGVSPLQSIENVRITKRMMKEDLEGGPFGSGIGDGYINLDQPSTYKKYLEKLSDDEAGALMHGNAWPVVKKQEELLKGLDTVTLNAKTVDGATSVTKTRLSAITGAVSASALKNTGSQIRSITGAQNRLRNYFTGKQWRPVDTRTLAPDRNTITGDQSGQYWSGISSGTQVRNTGFDTPFVRLMNINPEKGITQGPVVGGVQVNTMYDMLDIHQILPEKQINPVKNYGELNKKDPMKANTGTNYDLLEEVVRLNDSSTIETFSKELYSPTMMNFRRRMVSLVDQKVTKNNTKLTKAQIQKIANDDALYQANVKDKVDNFDNKYIRLSTKRDWLKKGKNRFNFINPDYDLGKIDTQFVGVLSNKNILGKVKDRTVAQMRGVRNQIAFGVGGTTPQNMGPIRRVLRSIASYKNEPITTEGFNPHAVEQTRNVLLTYNRSEMPTRELKQMWDDAKSKGRTATDISQQIYEETIRTERSIIASSGKDANFFIKRQTDLAKDAIKDIEDDTTIKAFSDTMTDSQGNKRTNSKSVREQKDALIAKVIKERDKEIAKQTKILESSKGTPLTIENKLEKDALNNFKMASLTDMSEGGIDGGPLWMKGSTDDFNQDLVPGARLLYGEAESMTPGGGMTGTRSATAAETYTLIKSIFDVKMGKSNESKPTDIDRILISKKITGIIESKHTQAQLKKAGTNKKSLNEFLAGEGSKTTSDPIFQSAVSEQVQIARSAIEKSNLKIKQDATKPGNFRVSGNAIYDAKTITANIVAANAFDQKTIGFTRQAAATAPTAANLYTQQPMQSETQYAIPSLLAGPQASFNMPKNMLEQTMGDIQSTLKGINNGNQAISENQSTQVKTYELPKGMESSTAIGTMSVAIGKLSTNTKGTFGKILASPKLNTEMSTNIAEQGQGLLEGLNINTLTASTTGQATRSNTDVITLVSLGFREQLKSFTKGKQKSMLGQVEKYRYDDRIVPKSDYELKRGTIKQQKVVANRIFPIIPVFSSFDPVQDAMRRRNMRPRLKKKKTWWQTPENWYEPYYWGGKNQTGTGYINFTGKEPGKVKKYEKRHFGIGVNDSPFGIKGKGF